MLRLRQREILGALVRLGERATAGQIAERLRLSVQSVTRTLETLPGVRCVGGLPANAEWEIDETALRSLPEGRGFIEQTRAYRFEQELLDAGHPPMPPGMARALMDMLD